MPKKLEEIARKRQVKHAATVLEPSTTIHTLVKLVDAGDVTNEKIRTLDIPVVINKVTSEHESPKLASEIYDPNPEVLFTETTDQISKREPQFQKLFIDCHKANNSDSNCFCEQHEDEERKRNSGSRSKPPAKSFIQNLKVYENQIHANQQPSSYPVNCYSRNSCDSRNRSDTRNRFYP